MPVSVYSAIHQAAGPYGYLSFHAEQKKSIGCDLSEIVSLSALIACNAMS